MKKLKINTKTVVKGTTGRPCSLSKQRSASFIHTNTGSIVVGGSWKISPSSGKKHFSQKSIGHNKLYEQEIQDIDRAAQTLEKYRIN